MATPEIVVHEARREAIHYDLHGTRRRESWTESNGEISKGKEPFMSFVPHWVRYMFVAVLGTLILGLPAIVIALTKEPDQFWPINITTRFERGLGEAFRLSLILGVTFGFYFLALMGIAMIPNIMSLVQFILNRDLLGQRGRDTLRDIVLLDHYFAFTSATLSLWILVRILVGDGDDARLTGDLFGSSKLGSFYLIHSAFALFLFALLLLMEKLIVQQIAVTYHYDYYATRIAANVFSLDVLGRLRKKYPPQRRASTLLHAKSAKDIERDEAKDMAISVFGGLITGDRDFLLPQDFEHVLTLEDAQRFFTSLDRDNNGDLTVKELIEGFRQIFAERDIISQSLASTDELVARLDGLGLGMVVAVLACLCLPIFSVSLTVTLFSLASGVMAAKAIFDDSMETLFSTIIFIFVSHPFDVGDIVTLDEKKFRVRDIGWWNSSFYGEGNTLVYFSNAALDGMYIGNFRRSRNMKETMEINVHFQTTREQLSKLEERIIDFIAQNTRDYESGTMMKVLRLNNRESMHIAFTVHHRSNFQSGENRNSRNIKFWETLRAAIAELHIKLAPAH